MTLKQLRCLREIVRHGLHLSRAADDLFISQPGLTRQIQLLEEELGIVLFVRKRNRILSLTEPGQQILRLAENALSETDNIRRIGEEYKNGMAGNLVIATNHTQARYRLPRVIQQFIQRCPDVHVEFWQGNQRAAFLRVDAGNADIAIGSHPETDLENVVMFQCDALSRCAIMQAGHPLLQSRKLTLPLIARYPLITHTGRWSLARYFEDKGLRPNIVFRAADADVCKAFAELGVGIAILTEIVFDPKRDRDLRAMSTAHLFPPEPVYVGLNRRDFHRQYLFDFVKMLAPHLTGERIEAQINKTT